MTVKDLRPRILVSNCLEHGATRYDGSMISNPFVKRLKAYVDFIPVCPEVAIGLPVPREAIRIVVREDEEYLVHSMTGGDVSEAMRGYTDGVVAKLLEAPLHGAILKSRSPSCGIKDVKRYKDIGRAPTAGGKTRGFFGGAVMDAFVGMAIEDEGRLTNFNIREQFLTRIYTMADFDEVKKLGTMRALVAFQSRHKYLLMAYHQANQKKLGKIVANHEHLATAAVFEAYEALLAKSLAKPLDHGRNTNMLLHIFGYFKDRLEAEEKAYFLDVLAQYNDKKVPFSVPLMMLGAWVIRFDEQYLKGQSIFEPFPKELITVTDSGKGID